MVVKFINKRYVIPSDSVKMLGEAMGFEHDLFKLINLYVSNGLKKPDLIHKMEYILESCKKS